MIWAVTTLPLQPSEVLISGRHLNYDNFMRCLNFELKCLHKKHLESSDLLCIYDSPDLTALFPSILKFSRLEITNCPALTEIFCLPDELKSLLIFNCPKLTQLHCLPEGLTTALVYNAESLDFILNLPPELIRLTLKNCNNLKTLPVLPEKLKLLDLANCSQLETELVLPANLQILRITNCAQIQLNPNHIPTTLVRIIIKQCPSISQEAYDNLRKFIAHKSSIPGPEDYLSHPPVNSDE